MALLGRCLAFYLKYPAEMKRLYSDPWDTGDEPDLEGLQNGEQVLNMIRAVGDTACREAADFLNACAERLDPHLQAIGKLKRVRGNLEANWSVHYKLWPDDSSKRALHLGFWIHDQIAAIVPWLWCRGGRHAEDKVVSILGRGIKPRSGEIEMESGTVALARIPVLVAEGPQAFDLDREPLVSQVYEAFEALSAENVKAIAALSSGSAVE